MPVKKNSEKVPAWKNKSLANLPGEKWKDVPGAEGYFQVSNWGRVKSLAVIIHSDRCYKGMQKKERILALSAARSYNSFTKDYTADLRVVCTFEKTRFRATVRRLVYGVFVLNGNFKKMKDKLVYPLDRDGYNCRVENLALATRSELRKSEFKRGRYKCLIPFLPKEKAAAMHRKIGIKLRKEICKYHPDGTLLATYPSLTAAAARNKVSISNIGSSASGRIHLLKGHVYRYKEDTYNGELKNYDSSKRQPIVQYALDGKKIADFPSIKEAAIQLKIHPNGIANTAKGKSRHAGGFIWRFEGESYNGEYRNILKKRKCIQLSLSGKQIRVFESVSLAAKTTGADFSGIKKVVDGARYSCKGYKWKWG